MPPRQSFYTPTSTVRRREAMAFQQVADTAIWELGAPLREAEIEDLGKLPSFTAGTQDQEPQQRQQPAMAPESDDLPIMMTPQPSMADRRQEEARQPRQPAPVYQDAPIELDTAGAPPPAVSLSAPAPGGASTPPGAPPSALAAGRAHPHVAPHLSLIEQVAREEEVPVDALAALMEVEQSGADSVSPAGARGLMQVVPGQGYDLPGENAADPLTSIRQGARALRDKYRYTGSWEEAGRAYFGYGTDAGGMRTDVYGQRYDAARQRYREQAAPIQQTVAPAPDAGRSSGGPLAVPPADVSVVPEARVGAAPSGGLDVRAISTAYEGVPYVFGGAGGRSDMRLGAASDCSGFVASVYRNVYGVDLAAHTDTSYNQLRQLGAPEVGQREARPGDVVYYLGAGSGGTLAHHMGIYAGPGKVLDMASSGGSDGVRVRAISHAGRFVILRDPRVNPEQPRRAEVPPEIVPTGYAERSPTGPVTPRQADAVIAQNAAGADSLPTSAAPPPGTGALPAGAGGYGNGLMLRGPLLPTPGDAFPTEPVINPPIGAPGAPSNSITLAAFAPGDGGYAPQYPELGVTGGAAVGAPRYGGGVAVEPEPLGPMMPPPSPYAPGQAESMAPAPGRFDQGRYQPPVVAAPGEPDYAPPTQPTTQTGQLLEGTPGAVRSFADTNERQRQRYMELSEREAMVRNGWKVNPITGLPIHPLAESEQDELSMLTGAMLPDPASGISRPIRRALAQETPPLAAAASRAGGALAEGRATAARTPAVQGGTYGTLGVTPDEGGGSRRFYHGTAGDFERYETGRPAAFDDGERLLGTNTVYFNSRPGVAGFYAESAGEVGQNVRPANIDSSARLFDLRGRVGDRGIPRLIAAAERGARRLKDDDALAALASARNELRLSPRNDALDSYTSLAEWFDGDTPELRRDAINRLLEAVGFDGIRHSDPNGGITVGLWNTAKVRNALSGEVGGATFGTLPSGGGAGRPDRLAPVNRALSQGLASTASGSVAGTYNQQANPDDPNAFATGFAAGAVGPYAAARGARALARRAGATAGTAGGTRLPGVFGTAADPDNALDAMRGRIIPPSVVDQLDIPIRIPEDPRAIRAIEAIGGSVDPEKGVTFNVIRYDGPGGHGGVAARGMPFYTAGPPGAPSPYAKGTNDPKGVGGTERIEGETRFRAPIIVDDAPGSTRGFDAAMRQMGVGDTPEVAEARRVASAAGEASDAAAARRNVEMQRWQAAHPRAPMDGFVRDPAGKQIVDEAVRAYKAYRTAKATLEEAEAAAQTPAADAVDRAVSAARRAGPEGSPKRAAALREVVTRFGGDPELIDPLLAIRGADASESGWAIRENILAAHARRNGYDGVITVQPKTPTAEEIHAHPKVVAALQAVRETGDEAERAAERLQAAGDDAIPMQWRRPEGEEFGAWFKRVVGGREEEYQAALNATEHHPAVVAAREEADHAAVAYERASTAWEKARADAGRELTGGRITELADVRESHNPTPGAPNPRVAEAETRLEAAMASVKQVIAAHQVPGSATKPLDGDAWLAAQHPNVQRAWKELEDAQAARRDARTEGEFTGPPGYTLRDDIPRRPDAGTAARGLVPFDPASAAAGGALGAATGEEGEDADPMRTAAGVALGILGGKKFPGVQRAIAASQRRAAAMAARGQAPLDPIQWTRKLAGEVGYSSMIGPSTWSVNMVGNALEPLWAIPKEATRAAVRGNMAEAGTMAAGAVHGMGNVWDAIKDAMLVRGKYVATPGHEPLSAQTVNPIGHAVASAIEFGGRFWSGVPDAIFGTIAQGAGEARAAAQIATDAGMKGSAWSQHVSALLADAKAVAAGGLPSMSGTQRVIDDGVAYARRQTLRDELGEIGKGVKGFATISVVPDGKGGYSPLPIIGNMATPFFNTPWNAHLRLAERTPGVGALMNTQRGFDKKYDQVAGTILLVGMGGYAASGSITGSGPSDPQKRKMLEAEGWRPYSTLIGGVYIPSRTFGVFGPMLNAVGDTHDAIAYAKDPKDVGALASNYAGRLGQQLQQQPYLQGLADIIGAIDAGQQGGLGPGAERYAASNITRMIPYAATARAAGTMADPLDRTTDRAKDVSALTSIGQRVRSGVGNRQGFPELGQQPLPAAQDVLGRPRPNPQQGAAALFARTDSRRSEPVVRAYLDAGVDISDPPPTIDKVPLTDAQKRRWNAVRGQALIRSRGEIMALRSLPKQVRAEELRGILREAGTEARDIVEAMISPRQRAESEKEN